MSTDDNKSTTYYPAYKELIDTQFYLLSDIQTRFTSAEWL